MGSDRGGVIRLLSGSKQTRESFCPEARVSEQTFSCLRTTGTRREAVTYRLTHTLYCTARGNAHTAVVVRSKLDHQVLKY